MTHYLEEFFARDEIEKEAAVMGLQPDLYPVFWRDAQTLAIEERLMSGPGCGLLPYWERVRALYIEMGGK